MQLAVSAAPCGYCRQLLAEAFCTCDPAATEPEAEARSRQPAREALPGQQYNDKAPAGAPFQLFIRPDPAPISLDSLLPMAFGPRELGSSETLFGHPTPQRHALVLSEDSSRVGSAGEAEEEVWGALARKALECATRSYSPYTCSPSGLALLTHVRIVSFFPPLWRPLAPHLSSHSFLSSSSSAAAIAVASSSASASPPPPPPPCVLLCLSLARSLNRRRPPPPSLLHALLFPPFLSLFRPDHPSSVHV